jgi:hypothetical protein
MLESEFQIKSVLGLDYDGLGNLPEVYKLKEHNYSTTLINIVLFGKPAGKGTRRIFERKI